MNVLFIRGQLHLASLKGHHNPDKIIQDDFEAVLVGGILWVPLVVWTLYSTTLQEFSSYWDQA